jgi:ribosomal protein S18 acetylase RimI-like enzyme
MNTYLTQPLDPQRHDRESFASGVRQVDNFFRKTANKLARAHNARTFVVEGGSDAVLGFYTLNAFSIHYDDLPERYARDRPGHGTIPAAFIAMIGVDARHQGQGLGRDLLLDCLARIADIERTIGLAVVVLDVLDCGDPVAVARRAAFYTALGFAALSMQPLRMILPTASLRGLFGDKGV